MKYTHTKTGKLYTFVDSALMKTGDGWAKSIIYKNSNGILFVREDFDFAAKFQLATVKECSEKINGSCPHHNLHCSYPKCEE